MSAMLHILPIFPRTALERALAMRALQWIGYTDASDKCLGEGAVVYTDDLTVCEAVREAGGTCHCLSMEAEHGLALLPPGSIASLAHAADAWPNVCSVMVIDYRCPPRDLADLEKAREMFRFSGGKPVVSVEPVRDHPVQIDMHLHFRCLDMDILCWVVAAAEAVDGLTSGSRVLRPFYFDWEYYGFGEMPIGALCVVRDLAGEAPHSLLDMAEYAALSGPDRSRVYVKSGLDMAHRVLDDAVFNSGPPLPVGLPFFRSLPGCRFMLLADTAVGKAGLYARADVCGPDLVARLTPFTRHALLGAQAGIFVPLDASAPSVGSVEVMGARYVGPLAELGDSRNHDGYLLALLKRTADGESDIAIPVQSAEALWHVDPVSRERRNGLTGRPIFGRQEFPLLYAPSRSLRVFRLADRLAFEDILASGDFCGLVMQGEE